MILLKQNLGEFCWWMMLIMPLMPLMLIMLIMLMNDVWVSRSLMTGRSCLHSAWPKCLNFQPQSWPGLKLILMKHVFEKCKKSNLVPLFELKQVLKALLDRSGVFQYYNISRIIWMIKSLKIVNYVLWLLTYCYMSWYCTMLCNFGTSIWYSWVFHNVRVLHHVMQLLNW